LKQHKLIHERDSKAKVQEGTVTLNATDKPPPRNTSSEEELDVEGIELTDGKERVAQWAQQASKLQECKAICPCDNDCGSHEHTHEHTVAETTPQQPKCGTTTSSDLDNHSLTNKSGRGQTSSDSDGENSTRKSEDGSSSTSTNNSRKRKQPSSDLDNNSEHSGQTSDSGLSGISKKKCESPNAELEIKKAKKDTAPIVKLPTLPLAEDNEEDVDIEGDDDNKVIENKMSFEKVGKNTESLQKQCLPSGNSWLPGKPEKSTRSNSSSGSSETSGTSTPSTINRKNSVLPQLSQIQMPTGANNESAAAAVAAQAALAAAIQRKQQSMQPAAMNQISPAQNVAQFQQNFNMQNSQVPVVQWRPMIVGWQGQNQVPPPQPMQNQANLTPQQLANLYGLQQQTQLLQNFLQQRQ
jgi:hypothetical protein